MLNELCRRYLESDEGLESTLTNKCGVIPLWALSVIVHNWKTQLDYASSDRSSN